VRENRFLELDVAHLGAERDLTSIPSVAEGIAQRHHPGGDEGRALLLGGVVLRESMRKQIVGGDTNFLSADGDRGGASCGI
jgi:hypothetical protein